MLLIVPGLGSSVTIFLILQRILPFAVYNDDLQWDQFIAAIAADRQELDAALEAEYRQDQADQDNGESERRRVT